MHGGTELGRRNHEPASNSAQPRVGPAREASDGPPSPTPCASPFAPRKFRARRLSLREKGVLSRSERQRYSVASAMFTAAGFRYNRSCKPPIVGPPKVHTGGGKNLQRRRGDIAIERQGTRLSGGYHVGPQSSQRRQTTEAETAEKQRRQGRSEQGERLWRAIGGAADLSGITVRRPPGAGSFFGRFECPR